MLRIEPLDAQDSATAMAMQALVRAAHVQESGWLGVDPKSTVHGALETPPGQRLFHLGAFRDGQLLGLLTLGPDDEAGQLLITTLVVDPGAQRQGLARQLLLAAFRRGPGMSFSVCAATRNQAAAALYQGLGFVPYRQGRVDGSGLNMTKLRRLAPAVPPNDSLELQTQSAPSQP